MKVLCTCPALFGDVGVWGGGERYALEFARTMASLLAPGSVTLYAAAGSDAERTDGALRIVQRRPWTLMRGQASNPLPRGLLAEVRRADVVHCFQHHITLTTVAIALARWRRIPVFSTDLGGGGWDLSSYADTRRWCTGLLHLSRYAATLGERAADPRDAVLYGGAADVPAGREDDGSVLFVGRLLAHKGVDVLLEATQPAWRTIVCGRAGDPHYQAELLALARGRDVRFVADADDAALDRLYRHAAVVVVPSTDVDRYGRTTAVAELLGLVAIEAMARGVPVVASRIASLPEVVEDGVTGVLIPPRDVPALRGAVEALLADPERRAAMGGAARQRAALRFSWRAAAETALAAYRRAGVT